MSSYDAIIVGSGPNGLAAGVVLARAGLRTKIIEGQPTIGGGARTLELTLPGFRHDVCSAIHPLAAASPFFRSLPLEELGVEFIHSPAAIAHPLDRDVALLYRDVEQTAAGLGGDERAYLRLMRPLIRDFNEVIRPLLFNPVTSPPPLRTLPKAAAFGLKALASAVGFAHTHFEDPRTKALLAGCAAHSFAPLDAPLTNAFALLLALVAHVEGWPLIRTGSGALVDALARLFAQAGGELETNRPVQALEQLPASRVVLFDTHAHLMERICGDALPASYRRKLLGFRRGPGVFKLDYALAGPMPWRDARCAQAATVHLGGPIEEVAESEQAVSEGRISERPFVLVAQQSVFDSTRAPSRHHTLWAYCHLPNASGFDATDVIEGQLERFAPGFRTLVRARSTKGPTSIEAGNASLLGGDISGGAVEGLQMFFRPVLGLPYTTPNSRVFLCSSSAPPGPGVHGMSGFHAAHAVLKALRR